MKGTLLPRPKIGWECPNCDMTAVSHETRAHSQMHPCPGLHGIIAPMVPVGMKCKVVAVRREDYAGAGVHLQRDNEGHPIMAIKTVRDDGEDCAVLAPLVDIEGKAYR